MPSVWKAVCFKLSSPSFRRTCKPFLSSLDSLHPSLQSLKNLHLVNGLTHFPPQTGMILGCNFMPRASPCWMMGIRPQRLGRPKLHCYLWLMKKSCSFRTRLITKHCWTTTSKKQSWLLNRPVMATSVLQGLSQFIPTDHRLARYAVEVISALARIDYDLVIPKLPRILPKILLVRFPFLTVTTLLIFSQAQGSMQSYLTLLDLLLTYHSKTRKIDTYIDLLFSTFSCHDTTSALGRPHQAYQLSLTGPLFQITHMKQLSTAIQRFLVDSQASKTVGVTFEFLTKVWEQLHSRETRVEVPDSHRGEERSLDERTAVVFSLSAHFAVIVLSSLPLQSISRANREQLDQHLKDIRHLMQSITRKSLKMILKTRHESVWPNSIVAVASLRLQYALDGHGTVPSSQGHDVKYYNKLLEVFQVDDLLPELRLEVVS